MTLVKLLDLFRRILNELDIGGLPWMTFNNLMSEMVTEYHLLFGIKARNLVQRIIYAMTDVPGERIRLNNLRSDIIARLEREYTQIAGKMIMLEYLLPLDDRHFHENPPLRRIPAIVKTDKSTQTAGTFQQKPVQALILE